MKAASILLKMVGAPTEVVSFQMKIVFIRAKSDFTTTKTACIVMDIDSIRANLAAIATLLEFAEIKVTFVTAKVKDRIMILAVAAPVVL